MWGDGLKAAFFRVTANQKYLPLSLYHLRASPVPFPAFALTITVGAELMSPHAYLATVVVPAFEPPPFPASHPANHAERPVSKPGKLASVGRIKCIFPFSEAAV